MLPTPRYSRIWEFEAFGSTAGGYVATLQSKDLRSISAGELVNPCEPLKSVVHSSQHMHCVNDKVLQFTTFMHPLLGKRDVPPCTL